MSEPGPWRRPRPGGRLEVVGAEPRPDTGEQRYGLVEALLELLARVGVSHDAAPDPEPGAPVGNLEGTDGDVQLEASQRAGDPDRPRVDLAGGAFQLAHQLHR